jgi:hypothetical protein
MKANYPKVRDKSTLDIFLVCVIREPYECVRPIRF